MLKARYQIGSIAGIPVRMHLSFLLIVAMVCAATFTEGLGGMLFGLSFLAVAYSCVVLHELGHCLVARRFGIDTLEIVLLPIGGVAVLGIGPRYRSKSDTEAAHDELRIALAGPAVNAVIACLLAVGMLVAGNWNNEFVVGLFAFNLGMGLFNLLLPAFPMDGGRVLRALLTPRLGKYGATQLAMKLGRGVAVLMAVLAAFVMNPILFLIAVFIWFAAGMEARGVPRPVVTVERPPQPVAVPGS